MHLAFACPLLLKHVLVSSLLLIIPLASAIHGGRMQSDDSSMHRHKLRHLPEDINQWDYFSVPHHDRHHHRPSWSSGQGPAPAHNHQGGGGGGRGQGAYRSPPLVPPPRRFWDRDDMRSAFRVQVRVDEVWASLSDLTVPD